MLDNKARILIFYISSHLFIHNQNLNRKKAHRVFQTYRKIPLQEILFHMNVLIYFTLNQKVWRLCAARWQHVWHTAVHTVEYYVSIYDLKLQLHSMNAKPHSYRFVLKVTINMCSFEPQGCCGESWTINFGHVQENDIMSGTCLTPREYYILKRGKRRFLPNLYLHTKILYMFLR